MPPLFMRAVSISALLCLTSAVSTATTPDEILNVVLQDIQALKEELADLKADNAQLQADNKDLRAAVGLPDDRKRRAAAPHHDDQASASPSQRKLTSSSNTRGSLLWSEGTFQFNAGSNFSGTVAAAGFQTKAPVSFVACATGDQQLTSPGTVFNFGSLESDRGGAFDTSSSTFTAPYNGLYLFAGGMCAKDDGDKGNWIRMSFSINGASQEACAFTKGEYLPIVSTCVRTYPLSAGDTVQVVNTDTDAAASHSSNLYGSLDCSVSFMGTLLTLL
jgi:regulator of replication initiation timing